MLLVPVLGWVVWALDAPWWVWVLYGLGAADALTSLYSDRRFW